MECTTCGKGSNEVCYCEKGRWNQRVLKAMAAAKQAVAVCKAKQHDWQNFHIYRDAMEKAQGTVVDLQWVYMEEAGLERPE